MREKIKGIIATVRAWNMGIALANFGPKTIPMIGFARSAVMSIEPETIVRSPKSFLIYEITFS